MKKYLLVYFLVLSISGFSQLDYGFNGKKNLIGANFQSATTLLYNDNVFFAWGTKLEYQRLVKSNFSVGIELGYRISQIERRNSNGTAYSLSGDLLDYNKYFTGYFNTIHIVPSVSVGIGHNFGFKGLSFQLGLGTVMHKLHQTKSVGSISFYSYDPYQSERVNELDEVLLTPVNKIYAGISFFAQLQKRTLLFNNFYLDIGLRLNSDFVLGNRSSYVSEFSSIKSNVGFDDSDLRDGLFRMGIYQVFSFKLGFAYQF